MKKILLTFGLLFLGANYANASVPQCYGDAGVSEEEPYILTIPNMNAYQAHLLIEDLMNDGFLTATKIFDHKPTCIFALAVNTSATLNIDERVAQKVADVLERYNLKYSLECNGTVTGNPRAGGSN